MMSEINTLIGQISDGLARENRLLVQGRINDALRQSDKRSILIGKLEQKVSSSVRSLDPATKIALERMLALNSENQSLLQAALAGYVAGKDMGRDGISAAGYRADGQRVYPVTEVTKKRI